MKKRFTLIELLAVIIILAVIALIATLIILNVIEDARTKADKNSAYGVLDGARLYYVESMLDTNKQPDVNGVTDLINKINISVEKPSKGNVYINSKGEIKVALVYGKKCYTKDFTATDLIINEDTENCVVISEPESKTNLISALLKQYSTRNTVGLLKDGNNYYYKGTNAEVANNFVWYEGHLWRVIQVNSDNTVTMVTQQPITAIQPASAVWTTEQQYKDSYINKWLNEVFYNSISNKSKIKQNTYNVGIYDNVSEITTTQYVGLLDENQYKRTKLENSSFENSFLYIKNGFLLGNRYDLAYVRGVGEYSFDNYGPTGSVGSRPVIKISDLTITSGNGTLNDPYREAKTSINTSDVKTGEYISVPGSSTYCGSDVRCLFRVVSKDNDSVKVILNGLLPTASAFDSSWNAIFNTSSPINTSLVNFANSINSKYRYSGNKIFNIGTYSYVSGTGQDYNLVKNQTYSGNIGLPVVGEIFSGNDINVGASALKTFVNSATIENPTVANNFWSMNAFDLYNVRYVYYDGSLNFDHPKNAYGVRPTMFLNLGTNPDLTFTKGEGTAENPYWLGN